MPAPFTGRHLHKGKTMKLVLRKQNEIVYEREDAGAVLTDALAVAMIHLQQCGILAKWFDRIGNTQHFAGGTTWHVQFGHPTAGGGLNLSDTYVAHWNE